MLYGLSTLTTSLPSVADPSDFTNYISQGGAAFIAASQPPQAPQPATAVPSSSGRVVVLGVVAAVAWWYWSKHRMGARVQD